MDFTCLQGPTNSSSWQSSTGTQESSSWHHHSSTPSTPPILERRGIQLYKDQRENKVQIFFIPETQNRKFKLDRDYKSPIDCNYFLWGKKRSLIVMQNTEGWRNKKVNERLPMTHKLSIWENLFLLHFFVYVNICLIAYISSVMLFMKIFRLFKSITF